MDKLIKYLQFVKQTMENLNNYKNVHIVLGNESCDLDSSVSAVAFAYFLHVFRCSKICENTIVIPVQNVSEEHFLLRTDNCYLYNEIGIPLDFLIYRNQLNFKSLIKSKKVTTTLVDYHVLPENHTILKDTVVQIFDHRPKDLASDWNENKIELNIHEVGSCSTLIADKILSTHEDVLFKELAYLLYATIIFDTQGLSLQTKRAKELDFQIVEKLEKKFNFTDPRTEVYKKIWKAHNDVSRLTSQQILVKDLKIVEKIPVPGLPMLVEDFLKLKGSYEAIKNLAADNNVSLLFLVGIDTTDTVRRDVAIYSNTEGEQLRDKLLNLLFNSQKLKGYDFRFKKVESNFEDIRHFKQENVTLSRKQIIPIIIEAVK